MEVEILADVRARCASFAQWQDRKFVPLPENYLNDARWQDAWQQRDASPAVNPFDEERRALQDQLIELRHFRDVTQQIDAAEFEAKARPIQARLRDLSSHHHTQPGGRA